MFDSMNKIDWELLHRQKLGLLSVLDGIPRDAPTGEALWGLVHLLDALQDDAVATGRWTFPEEQSDTTETEPSTAKRYYVEDDDGHHHGPFDDYDDAVNVAEAINGRIIVQEVDEPVRSTGDNDQGGA